MTSPSFNRSNSSSSSGSGSSPLKRIPDEDLEYQHLVKRLRTLEKVYDNTHGVDPKLVNSHLLQCNFLVHQVKFSSSEKGLSSCLFIPNIMIFMIFDIESHQKNLFLEKNWKKKLTWWTKKLQLNK